MTWQIRIPIKHFGRENKLQGLEKALGLVPDPQNRKKYEKFVFWQCRDHRPAVIKSAASAASPQGFPSRDPVGR